MKLPFAERLGHIDVIVLDVDGVLTDGQVIYSDVGAEVQAFHVRDGAGIAIWRQAGKRTAIVTGRGSAALERRATELGIDPLLQKIRDKKTAFEEVTKTLGVSPERVAVIADDLPDLPMIHRAALSFAVADASDVIRAAADMTTECPGGRGAVREVVEVLLKAQGRWDAVVEAFA